MKIKQKYDGVDFPYLAIWGYDASVNEIHKKHKLEDVVLVSLVDDKPYVQHLIGGKEGYFTERLNEYPPLPVGYKITFEQ